MNDFIMSDGRRAHDVDSCSCYWCGYARERGNVQDAKRALSAPAPPPRRPVGPKFPGVR